MSSHQRPDPDTLLQQMRSQEEQGGRGRLRIYFGANAGVGKTFAMLGAARRDHQAGKDVLVGLVETHGRSETAQLAEGLPTLPLRKVDYRGRNLAELDLDGALARKPTVLLVDELAHTNAPGSRHAKRWQDVQELLDAGIDVWSTLNVQHLESLNDTVGAITGIRVHETVPDTVLDGADEVVLVDVTPDELIARLKAGKVYLPQQAERAAQNFFRKGNLFALREIALRRTAEHVEDDVRSWRVEQSITPVWNTGGAILAAVGAREGGEQAVRVAARLAGQLNVRWHAAYVETPRLRELPDAQRDRVLAVLKLAQDLGASTSVLTASDVAQELVAHARQLNCSMLIAGRRRQRAWWTALLGAQLRARVAALAPDLDIVEVGHHEGGRRLPRVVQARDGEAPPSPWPENAARYAWAVGSSVLITLVATPLRNALDLANIAMLFLLGVVGVALRAGRGPAALAACLNVAAFDFFFVAPRLSFAVSDVQYLVTFAVMLVVGLVTGQLTAGLRYQADVAASRERRAQSLFALTRDLSGALLASQVVELGEGAARGHFGGEAVVLRTDEHDQLVVPQQVPEGFDRSVADWAFRNGQPAGLATSTLSAHSWHYVPLQAPVRVRGVLAIRPERPRWLLIPEQRQHLETLARQVAIALERVHYVEVAQGAVVEMESEQLRNALLASISHDIRTPLTALLGLSESLAASQPLTPAQAGNAQALAQQARELTSLVGNLLEMARLQSGKISLRLEWQSVEEIAGVALRSVRAVLGGREVRVDIPAGLPLVEFDATLMERVLANLLENAAKHGADPIGLAARALPGELELTVRDHGPGLPASAKGREQTLFGKFTRGEAESARPGVGLGLAIAKVVVEAHRGTIAAADAPGGGAVFIIRLPRREPPALPHAELE